MDVKCDHERQIAYETEQLQEGCPGDGCHSWVGLKCVQRMFWAKKRTEVILNS